ncbi:hypothetical protein ACFL3T_03225 [Patescibacteria group bacterium]
MAKGAPVPPWEQAEKAKSKPKSTAEKVKDLKTKISKLEETVKKLKDPKSPEARRAARKELRLQLNRASTSNPKEQARLRKKITGKLSEADVAKYSKPALYSAQRKLTAAKQSLNEVSAGSKGAKGKAQARIKQALGRESA